MALALPRPAETALAAVLVLATAVWIGGLIVIFVVARVARATLRTTERVAFFRGLGRAYGPVGGGALAAALATGAVLATQHPWDGQLAASRGRRSPGRRDNRRGRAGPTHDTAAAGRATRPRQRRADGQGAP
jgi:hypothetical protein